MMNSLLLPTFTDGEIGQHIARRVCARCYGDLQQVDAPDFSPSNHSYNAICPTCGDAWGGTTVSKHWAEKLGQQALSDKLDVTNAMPDLFPSPVAGKKPEEILKELGF